MLISAVVDVAHNALGVKSAKGPIKAHYLDALSVKEYHRGCELHIQFMGKCPCTQLASIRRDQERVGQYVKLHRAHLLGLGAHNRL